MSLQKRYAMLGAAGGAVLGAASMVVPTYLKKGLKLEPTVAVFVVIGMAIMGAIFGVMTAQSK